MWELYITKKERTALKGSIKKWENVINKKRNGSGSSDCPLCQIHNPTVVGLGKSNCLKCPIGAWVGEAYCKGTPYAAYERAALYGGYTETKAINLAKKELAFLKALLKRAKDL